MSKVLALGTSAPDFTLPVTPDQKLASCTAVIAGGLETQQDLAMVFNSRANAEEVAHRLQMRLAGAAGQHGQQAQRGNQGSGFHMAFRR